MNESFLEHWVFTGSVAVYALAGLAVCSLVTLGYIIQGFILLRRERIMPGAIQRLSEGMRDAEEVAVVRRRLSEDLSPLARVVTQMGRLVPTSTQEVEREADRLSGVETVNLFHRHVAPLVLMRNLSVYLGLFGTVLGIMHSFNYYIVEQRTDVQELGRGLAEALVATAWGLLIAITSMIFIHVFRERLIKIERIHLPRAALEIYQRLRPEPPVKIHEAASR